MSYNIDRFKVKKIENLVIPIKSIYPSYDEWFNKPEIVDFDTNKVIITGECEGFEMEGFLKDGLLEVTDLDLWGEFSGHFMSDALEPVLRESKGTLIATRVWEEGDSIDRLTVIDGNVKEEEIEL